MKKTTIALLVALALSVSFTPALAQTNDPRDTNYGLDSATDGNLALGTRDIREGVMEIINVLLGFLGIIAIIIILWGGFRWMTAGGNEEKVGEAKKIITAGIIGLIIIFVSYAIAAFVIEQLINATGANEAGGGV
jgi:amino acid transporter